MGDKSIQRMRGASTHRPRQAEVGTVPVVQRPPHRLWHGLEVSTRHGLHGALESATLQG